MKRIPLPLEGACLLEQTFVSDERGYFSRLFSREDFMALGIDFSVAQVNHSLSRIPGTIRGLHYQKAPQAEGKIFKCVRGAVFDVIVDVRKGSPSFLQWHGETLSPEDGKLIFVPPGFAHGVQALEPDSQIVYSSSAPFNASLEGRVRFDDPRVEIRWPIENVHLSPKDAQTPHLDMSFEGIEV